MKKKLCKVGVLGHFGVGKNLYNGQTIKTKILTSELENKYGIENIKRIDTHGGLKKLHQTIFELIVAFKNCENIIILPAQNGIRVFVPLCCLLNYIFKRKIHYVVIGGWLCDFLDQHQRLYGYLKKFQGIYVETEGMKKILDSHQFQNIYVMPNFKRINIISEESLIYSDCEPYNICTFSRVMKEKGIGEAVEAVSAINRMYGRVVFKLDIFGQIDSMQTNWFNGLKKGFPEFVAYKGIVPFEDSVEVLKNYVALLFPTYYEGEGFAGTLLDAMAAGVPAIASDWNYNREVVVNGKTGVLIDAKSVDAIEKALLDILRDFDCWNKMKHNCVLEAKKYRPDNAIQSLINNM